MNHRDERLGSAPLGKLMFSLAVPSVAAQLINVLYNIVDRIYIGHIPGYGDVALTGVGVTFPILTMISAFSAFAGMGGAPLASIQLGKKNKQGAERIPWQFGRTADPFFCDSDGVLFRYVRHQSFMHSEQVMQRLSMQEITYLSI